MSLSKAHYTHNEMIYQGCEDYTLGKYIMGLGALLDHLAGETLVSLCGYRYGWKLERIPTTMHL